MFGLVFMRKALFIHELMVQNEDNGDCEDDEEMCRDEDEDGNENMKCRSKRLISNCTDF